MRIFGGALTVAGATVASAKRVAARLISEASPRTTSAKVFSLHKLVTEQNK